MAIRFSKALDKAVEIDMTGVCDVIVDNELAIECKYIHGENRVLDNINLAESQIKKRVAENQATHGIIAIDLSNLIQSEKIKSFAEYLFMEFCNSHKQIQHDEQLITNSVILDRNFSKMIGVYIGHVMEVVIHSKFIQKKPDPILDASIWAIVYQMNDSLHFQYADNEIVSVPIRQMSYFINPNIPSEIHSRIKNTIHSLETGF